MQYKMNDKLTLDYVDFDHLKNVNLFRITGSIQISDELSLENLT